MMMKKKMMMMIKKRIVHLFAAFRLLIDGVRLPARRILACYSLSLSFTSEEEEEEELGNGKSIEGLEMNEGVVALNS